MEKNLTKSVHSAVLALCLCAAANTSAADETPVILLDDVPTVDWTSDNYTVANLAGQEGWELKEAAQWSVGNPEAFKYFHLESAYIESEANHDDWFFIPVELTFSASDLDLSFEYLTSADSDTGHNLKVCIGDAATPEAMTTEIFSQENCKTPGYNWFNKQTFNASHTVAGSGLRYIGFAVNSPIRRDDWINILNIKLTATPAVIEETPVTLLGDAPTVDWTSDNYTVANLAGQEGWELKEAAQWSVGNPEAFKYFHLESAYIESEANHDDWFFIPVTLTFPVSDLDLSFEYLTSADSGTGHNLKVCIGDAATPEAMTTEIFSQENCKTPGYNWFNVQTLSSKATVIGVGPRYIGFAVNSPIRRDDWINIHKINLIASPSDIQNSVEAIGDTSAFTVAIERGAVIVNGAAGKTVSVFSIEGRHVASLVVSDSQRIELAGGVYMVAIGGKAIKVAVR